MNVTIKDIAEASGVSIGTVDRVLHNRKYVNPDVKRRVLEQIERLGYKPNRHASLLSTGVNKKIALICNEAPNFFWDEIARGAIDEANNLSNMGLSLIVKRLPPDYEKSYSLVNIINDLKELNIDLIIIALLSDIKTEELIYELKIPVVTLNIDFIDKSKRIFYVGPDEQKCGRIAAGITARFMPRKDNILVVSSIFNNAASHVIKKRLQGFNDIIKNEFPKLSVCDEFSYDFSQGTEVDFSIKLKDIIHSHKPAAIYTPDGTLVNIIANAIKGDSIAEDVVLVGHEINSKAEENIKANIITSVISQKPYNQGMDAIKSSYLYLMEKKIPDDSIINADLAIITKEIL